MALETVDLPIYLWEIVIFDSYVGLQEGIWLLFGPWFPGIPVYSLLFTLYLGCRNVRSPTSTS